jgi:hypothetical protein
MDKLKNPTAMKHLMIKKSANPLVSVCAALLLWGIACDPPEREHTFPPEEETKTFKIGPEGGDVYAMDRNISFWFPKDAVSEEVVFTIESLNSDNDFYIHSICLIPESFEFNKPVGISMKYDGCLKNGMDPCKAECLALYRFETDIIYETRRPSDLVWIEQCHLNSAECCIETLIPGGGVYAVGEASLDQTEH